MHAAVAVADKRQRERAALGVVRIEELLGRRGEVGRAVLEARVLAFDIERVGGAGRCGQPCRAAQHQHESEMFHRWKSPEAVVFS